MSLRPLVFSLLLLFLAAMFCRSWVHSIFSSAHVDVSWVSSLCGVFAYSFHGGTFVRSTPSLLKCRVGHFLLSSAGRTTIKKIRGSGSRLRLGFRFCSSLFSFDFAFACSLLMKQSLFSAAMSKPRYSSPTSLAPLKGSSLIPLVQTLSLLFHS